MVDVRDDGHVSDVGGLVCEPVVSDGCPIMRQKSLEKFSRLFYAALYPGNGKLLTHKRTDLVDSEARALLVLIRGEV